MARFSFGGGEPFAFPAIPFVNSDEEDGRQKIVKLGALPGSRPAIPFSFLGGGIWQGAAIFPKNVLLGANLTEPDFS